MSVVWKSYACLVACAGALVVRAATIECGFGDKAVKCAADELELYLNNVEGRVRIVEDDTLKSQEWRIKATDGDVTISGCDGMGAIYGVYDFLEKHLGFRWYAPDTIKTPLLSKNALSTLAIDQCRRPAILAREMYVGSDTIDGKWRLRNKETARAAFGVGVSVGSPRDCHTFTWYNNAIGAKERPEIIGVNAKGKPTGLFCPSNPEARRLVGEQMKKTIRADRDNFSAQGLPRYTWPTIYELSQDDGGGEFDSCMCPKCKALFDASGSWSGVNIAFASAVAKQVAEEFPDVIVRTFAYSYTEHPPTNIFCAAENLCVRYCRSFVFQPLIADNFNGEIMKGWDDHVSKKHVWGYWRSFSGPLYPMVKPRSDIGEEMKFCRDMNVHGYFAQNEKPLSRSFSAMQHWLFLKLAENPDLDVFALSREFIDAYYGAAAKPITEYLCFMERRELADFATVDPKFLSGVHSGDLAQYLKRDYLDREFFEKANAWLEEAEQLVASDPLSLRHVRLERLVVDRTMRDMYDSLVRTGYKPDMKAAAERTASALPDIVTNWCFNANQKVERMLAVKREIEAAKRYPIALPPELEGRDVIQWQLLSRGFSEKDAVADPDSVTGYACVFPVEKQKLKPPFFAGAWDSLGKRGCELKLNANEIPQDEKFHVYRIGEVRMLSPGYMYFNSWHYRTWLQTLGIEPEIREVWISVKFTGPNYVNGSNKANEIRYERVFLVRPNRTIPAEATSPSLKPEDTTTKVLKVGDGGGYVCEKIESLPVACRAVRAVEGHEASLLPNGRKFKLVWHDEFDGNALDESKWSYRTNFWGRRAHWFAAPEDGCVEVADGKLHLKLKKLPNGQFVSPQLQTGELMWDIPHAPNPSGFWPLPKREKAKFVHKYGYYECRCRLQKMPGWWSAFWMQSEQQGCSLDPAVSGIEHDIMESFDPGEVIVSAFHTNGYGSDYMGFHIPAGYDEEPKFEGKLNLAVDTENFHTYGMLWEPDGYSIYVDGRFRGRNSTAVSHIPEFVLLTTEVKWYRNNRMTGTGVPELEASAKAGDDFVVDYVRVYDIK